MLSAEYHDLDPAVTSAVRRGSPPCGSSEATDRAGGLLWEDRGSSIKRRRGTREGRGLDRRRDWRSPCEPPLLHNMAWGRPALRVRCRPMGRGSASRRKPVAFPDGTCHCMRCETRCASRPGLARQPRAAVGHPHRGATWVTRIEVQRIKDRLCPVIWLRANSVGATVRIALRSTGGGSLAEQHWWRKSG